MPERETGRYHTEKPGMGEYPEWVDWADNDKIIGYGDIDETDFDIDWFTYVTPGYFRRFAEIVEYAYGKTLSNGDPNGSVELGVGFKENGAGPCVLLARPTGDDSGKGVVCATRIEPSQMRGEEQ